MLALSRQAPADARHRMATGQPRRPAGLAARHRLHPQPGPARRPGGVGGAHATRARAHRRDRIAGLTTRSRRRSSGAERGTAPRRAEDSLFEYGRRGGVAVTVLRPTMLYGSGRDSLSQLVATAHRWRLLPLPAGATGLRQPVHVGDVARACSIAATRRRVTARLRPARRGGARIPAARAQGAGAHAPRRARAQPADLVFSNRTGPGRRPGPGPGRRLAARLARTSSPMQRPPAPLSAFRPVSSTLRPCCSAAWLFPYARACLST